MPRPKIQDEDRRDIKLTIHVNLKEYNDFKTKAVRSKMSVSKLARVSLMKLQINAPEPMINKELLSELGAEGRNLNQLLKAINTTKTGVNLSDKQRQFIRNLNDKIDKIAQTILNK